MDHRYLLALSGLLLVIWLVRHRLRRRRRRRGGGTASVRRRDAPLGAKARVAEHTLPSESDLRAAMRGLLASPPPETVGGRDLAAADRGARAAGSPGSLGRAPVEVGADGSGAGMSLGGGTAAHGPIDRTRSRQARRLERSRVEALTRRVELTDTKVADRERTIALLRREIGELEAKLAVRDAELVPLRTEVGRSASYRKRIVALDTALSRLEVAAGSSGDGIEVGRLRGELESLRRGKSVSPERVAELERRVADRAGEKGIGSRTIDQKVRS